VPQIVSIFGGDLGEVRKVLCELIQDETVGIIYADAEINPHIIRTHFESPDIQIDKLKTDSLRHSCAYPRPKHLKKVVDYSRYAGEPYKLSLAHGEPQLAYRSFDLSVLEFYRNDPRYLYQCSDISGFISVRHQYYESENMDARDKVLLESFGFSYDDDYNRAVAVFLRYLADLSPEHQQTWKTKELTGDYRLHPDYFRTTIIGDWGERVSVFDAFTKELWLINRMSEAMGRLSLFRRDFGEYGDEKPTKFSFLIRPTLDEYNGFVLLLDKMLSDNINKDFFQNEVAYETDVVREDGKVQIQYQGTLQILDDWIRKFFRTDDWEPWNESIKTLRDVRKKRQNPAHAINDNLFDQQYFKDQRQLIIRAYTAVRTLRMLLENHPAVRASDVKVPDWLREGKIWNS